MAQKEEETNPTDAKRAAEWSAKWYAKDPPEIRPDVKQVLEDYSKIPSDEILSHVSTIREKAWEIHKYPCIGSYRFLDLAVGEHSKYAEVLERMKSGDQIYLDLGCAFAQDVRKLVSDGVDSTKIYGSDLRLDFIDLGYELFNDKHSLKTEFIEADIFDKDSALSQLNGKVDIVGASSFFHLFGYEEQKTVAHRVIALMKPVKGSMIIGRQAGSAEPGEKSRNTGAGSRYRHNVESWKKMWKEVGDEAGLEFDVSGRERALDGNLAQFREIADIFFEFTVRRM